MTKLNLKNWFVMVLCVLMVFAPLYAPNAWARGGGHGDAHYYGHGGDGGHGHYYYHGGYWHDDNWWWPLAWFATGFTVGTVISTLPPHYQTIYVSGAPYPYYYYDGAYFTPSPSGYVVVPAPSAATVVTTEPAVVTTVAAPNVQQPNAPGDEKVVINIPNVRGGYTPVTLTKHNTGYIGPQGEYYEGHPTIDQLKVLYGN